MITLEKAKEALGVEALNMSDDQIMQMVENLQVLARQWNEMYQRHLFGGKTVNELLTASKN